MPGGEPNRLRFNILGPLEGWADDARLRLGGPIQERVLVALLLEPGKVLPVSRLVAVGWADDPPTTATHQIRKAVADLRRRIPGGADVLVTDGPGYRGVVADSQLDLVEFGAQVAEAKNFVAAGRLDAAAAALRASLALWRGPVLSGEGGPVIDAVATALGERRLAAAEQLFEIRRQLGETAEVVADIRELISQYPLRETLRGQLMLALYHSGRQAEALEEYGTLRDQLVEELGIDPSAQLARIYEGILRDDPEFAAPVAPSAGSSAVVAAPAVSPGPPCNLPYDITDFTGRDQALRFVLSCAQRPSPQGARIVAIDGMGGCGKTTLTVRAAHQLSEHYPDGQLHLDMCGYTIGEEPVTADAALDSLLRAFGLPGDRIPEDTAARSSLWHTILSGKRVLLLLDNAVDAASVGPLLPRSPDCLVLITSRARLLDLDGADWISLDVLEPEEAAAFIASALGPARVAAEPEAAVELAHLCGYLPLAVRIATARLRNRPRWTLRYLVDRLRDENRRLNELNSGERGVATTLRLSYQALDQGSRTAFRILALHPGHDLDLYSATAMLGSDHWQAEDTLEQLLDTHLLQQPEIGRYRFHDLVRSFAHSLQSGTGESEARLATERVLDYYLAVTELACNILFPGRQHRPTGLPETTAVLPDLANADQARDWFTREQPTLLSAVRIAEAGGFDRQTACLARNIVFHLNSRGQIEEFGQLSRTAIAAARRLGDLSLLCVNLSNLGAACWKLGRYHEGMQVAREGRELAVRLGDRVTEAHSERVLGLYHSLLGHFPEALPHLERAIALERELGSTAAEVESLTVLSTLYEQWGRHQEAADAARQAVALIGNLGGHDSALVALTDLAFAYAGLRQYAEAESVLSQARALCDTTSDPGHVAMALALSADMAHRLGRAEDAARHAEGCREAIGKTVSPLRLAKIHNVLGRYHYSSADYPAALTLHSHALQLASSISYRAEEAYALSGMASAAVALGDATSADGHRAAAEALFAVMGVRAHARRV
jgi:DNA-binding SARP family transcriptional activator